MSYPRGEENPPRIRFAAIGGAWALYQQQMGTWMLIGVITGVILICAQSILSFLIPTPRPEGFNLRALLATIYSPSHIVLGVVVGTVYGVIEGAIIHAALKQIRGEGTSVSALLEVGDVMGKLVLLGLVESVLSTAAALLCILPSFVVWSLLMFAVPLVVDQKMEPLDAVRQSFNMLKSHWLTAFLFNLAAALVSTAGAILCCVGILLSMPLYYLSIALLYDDFVRGAVEP